MTQPNRYAKDWDEYSKQWESRYAKSHKHLGDEWNDDGTAERRRDNFYFLAYADRWLRPDMTVLEVGPGGGKWTVRIAPRVKRLIVLDVSKEMLSRTKARCEAENLENVEFVLANGRDFQPVADGSVDLFFSYDVFVHIALEDTWPYVQEMARVLAPGGMGICHHAVNTTPDAWDRIEQHNDWYRADRNTLGQYYYHSPESLRRLYERCGFSVLEQHQEFCHCTCVFERPANSIVPELEQLLRQLISADANDEQVRARIVQTLAALPAQMEKKLQPLLTAVAGESDYFKRIYRAAEIRRCWRGC